MNRVFVVPGLAAALFLSSPALAQRAAPGLDDNVAQIPQTSPGSPWSFIGFSITTPLDQQWFVANSTPRGGTMGRNLSAAPPNTAVLVIVSELLDKPIDSDTELLALAQDRHARIGERWVVSRHDESIVRHAGTRCARHTLAAREPEDKSPRKDAAKANATRPYLHPLPQITRPRGR